mmetsp:Transcript_10989/g.19413  ORF Transcript_10989/g.19413 Transcript_10989/m.19413 type:complete len:435 (-) Transcript_10989:321-1625(-)|eukprot:CAMPEP_0184545090 /NCGR_PEP_ID=MMETSP0199_2-20130426/4061_1 /TAXON_ID=1112570 /ORGANISM="Thraustochytrium sp., Strain LLF1b" /LENGTH=434 /DNA_ID=CAMNT_0026939347 /DNA_START=440 /DNA_END=1741 /DNA_ORIENTATION=+
MKPRQRAEKRKATDRVTRGAAKHQRAALENLTNVQNARELTRDLRVSKRTAEQQRQSSSQSSSSSPPATRANIAAASLSRNAQTSHTEDSKSSSLEPWWGEGVFCKAGPGCRRGRNTTKVPEGVEDIDLRHPKDPLYCPEYVKDIHSYLRSHQDSFIVEKTYMATVQANVVATRRITPHMRAVLVDWLVEKAEDNILLSDTLYLSVCYLDRVLSKVKIHRPQLQLLGCTCLFVAGKYEEHGGPIVDEIVVGTEYDRSQILKMERLVLDALDFRLTMATCKTFLRRFQRAACVTGIEKHFSDYVAELSLLCYEMVACPADVAAAAAVYLARLTIYASDSGNELNVVSATFRKGHDEDVWTEELKWYTGYTGCRLAQVIRKLRDLHISAWKSGEGNLAVYEKYKLPIFERVATRVKPYSNKGSLLPVMNQETEYVW